MKKRKIFPGSTIRFYIIFLYLAIIFDEVLLRLFFDIDINTLGCLLLNSIFYELSHSYFKLVLAIQFYFLKYDLPPLSPCCLFPSSTSYFTNQIEVLCYLRYSCPLRTCTTG